MSIKLRVNLFCRDFLYLKIESEREIKGELEWDREKREEREGE